MIDKIFIAISEELTGRLLQRHSKLSPRRGIFYRVDMNDDNILKSVSFCPQITSFSTAQTLILFDRVGERPIGTDAQHKIDLLLDNGFSSVAVEIKAGKNYSIRDLQQDIADRPFEFRENENIVVGCISAILDRNSRHPMQRDHLEIYAGGRFVVRRWFVCLRNRPIRRFAIRQFNDENDRSPFEGCTFFFMNELLADLGKEIVEREIFSIFGNNPRCSTIVAELVDYLIEEFEDFD